jgi:hypothetical protein
MDKRGLKTQGLSALIGVYLRPEMGFPNPASNSPAGAADHPRLG